MEQFELGFDQKETIGAALNNANDLAVAFDIKKPKDALADIQKIKTALELIKSETDYGELKYDLITRRALAEKLGLRFVGKFYEGLAVAIDTNFRKYFINKDGQDINKGKRFYEARNFQDGLAAVQIDGAWYLIDKNGEPPAWNWFTDKFIGESYAKEPKISEGLISFEDQHNQFIYRSVEGDLAMNESGDILYSFDDGAEYCREGFIWTQSGPLNCVFRDKTGEIAFSGRSFESAEDFSDGLALVSDKAGYFYINTKGEDILSGKRFKKAHSFCEDVARIMIDGNYYFINKSGEIIFNGKFFNWVSDFREGFAVVEDISQKKYYINKEGEEAFPGKYFDKASDFSNAYAVVTFNGRKRFIDNSGNFVFSDQEFSDMESFKDGVARVHCLNPERDLYIDIKGQPIFNL